MDLLNLRNFVQKGGVVVAAGNSADFMLTNNIATGATSARPSATSRVVGSLLRTTVADAGSPIMYGIPTNLAVYSDRGESFNAGGGGGGRGAGGGGAAVAAGGGRGGGAPTRATG